MEPESKPEPQRMIEDLETLRVLADPLRSQVLEALVMQPLTVKGVAARLGLAPGKLYYHINLLEQYDLIRVVQTHMVANLMEKIYQASAEKYVIAQDLLNFSTEQGQQNVSTMLTAPLDITREDLLRSIQARLFSLERGAPQQPRQVIITRELSRLPASQLESFQQRLKDLVEEFCAQEEDPQEQAYALMVAFYPTFYYPEES